MISAYRRTRLTLAVLASVVATFGLAQLWTVLFPTSIAASGPEIRVRLVAHAKLLRIEATDVACHPAPRRTMTGPLEVRPQARGLLVLGADGAPFVHNGDMLELTWSARAHIETDDHRGRKAVSEQIGHLRIYATEDGMRVVLHTDIELYLTGVVQREMGPRFPLESLKAQAVAARSFAWSAAARRTQRTWDVRADTTDQVFHGPSDTPSVVEAVRSTLGEYVQFGGKPIRAYYSSTCGGRTRDGKERFRDVPASVFRSVECTACSASPLYRWTRSVSVTQLARLAPGTTIAAAKRSARGDWTEFRIGGRGTRSSRTFPIGKLARIVRLPSPWITRVEYAGSKVLLHGRGFGHGVGLCQYGAAGRAKAGKTYREILAYYYSGTSVGPLPPAP